MEFDESKNYRRLPSVALAGRPNVGKSTLFNRLLRSRRAITDPTPGVTRDPVEADGFLLGKPVRLIDTGGFKLDRAGGTGRREAASDEIDDLVLEKTKATIERADLVVLLLEAGELTLEDEEFIAFLRPRKERLIVAVNKCEGGRREAESWNLLSRGFESIFMISAEHGDNIGDLSEEIVRRLDFSAVEEEAGGERPIRVALLGKPNTGKSTLSNRLTSSNASIVSAVPGTTRDVVEGGFEWTIRGKRASFALLDTAGIRRRARITENIEYYSVNRAIKAIDDADVVILLIDALEGLSDQDKKIAALACEKGRGVIMALNKWDAMPQEKNLFEATADKIRYFFGQMEFAPIVPLSAQTGEGVEKLLSTVMTLYRQLCIQVETGRLNQALKRWMEETPPPSGPRTRFSIKYAAQVSANPVRFVFFCSRVKAISEAYVSYLRGRIRRDLGFSAIPVEIKLRASGGKKGSAGKARS
ncbi:MAG: ribosome biogenesis GTPase Der [Treponema sp.]|nr:ribosome biogenesis GTPase Der [Treponema sp.]